MPERFMMLPPQGAAAPTRYAWRTPVIAAGFAALAAILVAVMLRQPLYGVATLYGAAVMMIAWRRPDVSLILIFASAALASDVSQGALAKFSIAEVNLVLALPAFYFWGLVRRKLPTTGPIALPVALYLGVCLYASWIHWRGEDALISLIQMGVYLVFVVAIFANFARKAEDLLRCLFGLVVTGVAVACAALATNFTFLDQNKNGLGDLIASALQVTVILLLATEAGNRRRKYLLTAALVVLTAGLVLSLSRGSWLGTLSGLIMIFALRREFRALLRLFLVVGPIILVCWFSLPQDLQAYSTGFGRDRYNINARYESVDLAERYFVQSPVYGAGVGLRKEYDATNTPLMILAETGVLGLLGFLLIHAAFYRMVWFTQKRLPVQHPLHPLLCVGAALLIARFMHGMVDHYWTRGVLMTSWAAVGMTTAACLAVHQRIASGAPVDQRIASGAPVREQAEACQKEPNPAA